MPLVAPTPLPINNDSSLTRSSLTLGHNNYELLGVEREVHQCCRLFSPEKKLPPFTNFMVNINLGEFEDVGDVDNRSHLNLRHKSSCRQAGVNIDVH